MKLLIDTNILLDVLVDRNPHVKYASLIWKLCETNQAQGFVPAFSFTNLTYILRKELQAEAISLLYQKLSLIFTFTELKPIDLREACRLGWRDYEDALQAVIAKRVHADYIISRNTQDYKNSPVPAIKPQAFLSLQQ